MIKTIPGFCATDDRGSVRFANDFTFENVKRFYQVQNHRSGFIRAWHGHQHEGKYVWVAKGSALVGAFPLNDKSQIFKTVLTDVTPKVLYIPAGYANGFKTLTPDTIVQFFSTSTLEESKTDDIRMPYDTVDIWQEEYR
jgi:dTDP-4-dehydrorhamnose 3,5-epimerase